MSNEYNDVRRYLEKKWFASGNLCQDWDLNDEGIIVINKFNEEGKIIYNSLHEDSGNIISKKGEYLDNKGELVQFETEFSSDKKTTNYIKEGRLCSKYEIDSLNKKITTRRYNENGELESETIRKDGKQIYSYLKEN